MVQKKVIKLGSYFILTCVFLSSCISGKVAVKTGIEEICFGYGGGFTGKSTTYVLSPNGYLSKQGDENKVLKKVDYKTTLEFFTIAQEIQNVLFNEPENAYSFVQIESKNSANRIVWATGSTKGPRRVVLLYDQLISITK
jgi:hypothetical protein